MPQATSPSKTPNQVRSTFPHLRALPLRARRPYIIFFPLVQWSVYSIIDVSLLYSNAVTNAGVQSLPTNTPSRKHVFRKRLFRKPRRDIQPIHLAT